MPLSGPYHPTPKPYRCSKPHASPARGVSRKESRPLRSVEEVLIALTQPIGVRPLPDGSG